jgi:hypothetical protein
MLSPYFARHRSYICNEFGRKENVSVNSRRGTGSVEACLSSFDNEHSFVIDQGVISILA